MPSKNPWNEINKKSDSKPKNTESLKEDSLDSLIKSVKEFFNKSDSFYKISLGLIGFIFLYFLSGFYIVRPHESAVNFVLGKFSHISYSGLNYNWPYPIGNRVKKSTQRINSLVVGSPNNDRKSLDSGLMITSDENMLNVECEIQWKISNIKDFLLEVRDPYSTIADVVQSTLRDIIARKNLFYILTSGRAEIEQSVAKELQSNFDSYKIGVEVVNVQLLKADPPAEVIDSFRDVQTARVDMEKMINEANAYKNEVIPNARANAFQIEQDAISDASKIFNHTKEYLFEYDNTLKSAKSPAVRKKIYYDTMSKVIRSNDFIFVDPSIGNSLITPHLMKNGGGDSINYKDSKNVKKANAQSENQKSQKPKKD